MYPSKNVCRSTFGIYECQFPRRHGGYYHGQFNKLWETVFIGAFKILWPIKRRVKQRTVLGKEKNGG